MKNLLLILICLFVSFESLNGQAHTWTKVHKLDNGGIIYIDFENIRKNNGFVYYRYNSNFQN